MELELPYTVDASNKLPNLNYANAQFLKEDGPTVLKTSLKELFTRHQMTQSFGLRLLHRHFNPNKHETLVETNDTSMPGGFRLVPYEYYFDRSPATKSSPELGTDFVEDLSVILETHKLSNDLGLRLLGDVSQRQLEVTEGAANVNFPLDNGALPSTDNSDNYIEATW